YQRRHWTPLALEKRHAALVSLRRQRDRLAGGIHVRTRGVRPVQNRERWITKDRSQPALQLARCRVPPELDHEATGPGVPLLGFQLASDESDRHDAEFLRRVEQPAARLLPGGIRLENNLAEPGERILHVCLIVDRQSATPT